jgi:hypothetical protein
VRRHIGQELLANRRPAPVRTDQQIAASDPAVLELRRDAINILL